MNDVGNQLKSKDFHHILCGLLNERLIGTLLIAVFLILLVASLRHDEFGGPSLRTLNMKKILWNECADIVIAGDSRIRSGISPEAMKNRLSGMRILNYGFGYACYSDSYLHAVEKVLDNDNKRKIIVLGITPMSLTFREIEKSVFQQYADGVVSKKENIKHFLGSQVYFLRPFDSLSQFFKMVRGETIGEYQYCYYDGWVAQYTFLEADGLGWFTKIFRTDQFGPVSSERIKKLILKVNEWHNKEIEIYGFRPPTTPEMIVLENNESKFDEKVFVEEFQNAGGVWLDFETSEYHCYDTSHLYPDSAIRLSLELARKISLSE